jgi:hypothetical protein
MAYVRKHKLYKLDFTGTTLEGLTMVMKGMTIGEALQLQHLRDLADKDLDTQLEGLTELMTFVAERIVEWDMVEEDGTPVPATREQLMSLDMGDTMLAVERWQAAVEDVPAPLEQPSNGGSTSGTSATSLPPLPMQN